MPTLNLQPDATTGKDTSLRQPVPTRNFGISTPITVGRSGGVGTEHWSLIQFDLSSIPSVATILSATLTLWVISEETTTDIGVTANRSLVEWFEGLSDNTDPGVGENASTWNFRNANGSVAWGTAGGQSGVDFAATATDTTTVTGISQYFDWDVTADVQNFVNGTYTNYGWWLRTTNTAAARKVIATSDHATASLRPELVVVYAALMTGSSSGVATGTGTLVGKTEMRGFSDGIADVDGTLISNSISASSSGIATVSGILLAQIHLEGTSSGIVTVVGDLSADAEIAGTAAGVATVTALASFEGQLRGSSSGVATIDAILHVYARHIVRVQGCYTDPLFYITDGTVKDNGQLRRLDLINPTVGYILDKWRPTIAQYKEGGTWSESSRGTGRRLTNRIFGNAIEVFELKVKGYNQNDLFQYTHEYFTWQEEAADFWVSDWGTIPVYLVAKGPRESNPRYAVIYAMSVPELDNPYAQPVHNIHNSVIEQLTLRLERGDWMSQPPGQSECVAISSARSWTIAGWSTGS